jgi:hypothetical protein
VAALFLLALQASTMEKHIMGRNVGGINGRIVQGKVNTGRGYI